MDKKNTKQEENTKKVALTFAAIDKYVTTNIVENVQKEVPGHPFVQYGIGNKFPQYVYDLSLKVPSLQAIINAFADYTVGDGVVIDSVTFNKKINKNDDTIEDLVRMLAVDYARYGGFAINVCRNKAGKVVELYYLDFKNLRSDKKNKMFFYSEDWVKSYGRVKHQAYPAFDFNDDKQSNSVVYYKNDWNAVYPNPLYYSALESCEVEKAINEYHLNNINNNLMADFMVCLNGGIPSEEVQKQIEADFNDKFTGKENAGRVIIAYSNGKDNAPTVEKLSDDDYHDRYTSIAKRAKEQIFTAFRVSPQILGIPLEDNGFSDEDYQQAFKLFNRCTIRPLQKKICTIFSKIFGRDIVTIKPFTIEWEEGKTNDENVQ